MAIKVGFVGAGGRARSHMRVLQGIEDVDILAICDVLGETAERVAGEYGARAYTDHRKMLDSESLIAAFRPCMSASPRLHIPMRRFLRRGRVCICSWKNP